MTDPGRQVIGEDEDDREGLLHHPVHVECEAQGDEAQQAQESDEAVSQFDAHERLRDMWLFPRQRKFTAIWIARIRHDGDSDSSSLPGGVMVTQRPLEPLFMVRIHAGQPIFEEPKFALSIW